VTGANLGQPVGIVMLSPTVASASAAERSAISEGLSAHLAAVNAKLDPHEQLDCVTVITTPWTVDNGFITPTFKVKRNHIEEVYGPKLEGWAAQRKPVVFGD
ncbi:MAG: AMP-binding acetyl-CoA synthetase, partial [Burkholderiaceae bacterium]|nr:AMP-binding acetyl-CoA synthetase [Burkholderiaceae bacterium]